MGNSFLAARWINLSIQSAIATVHQWMDVAGMLSMVEQDAPELARMVHPLLEQVGTEQQRLLILLAILQGIYFTYCQTQHMVPTLLALPEEEEENQNHDQSVPTLFDLVPDDDTITEEGRR